MPARRRRQGRARLRAIAASLLVGLLFGRAATAADGSGLAVLSLEELMEIEVYTAARTDQPLRHTAAAATVLTANDLRRAGVTTIPEALRLVPGMEVARIDASKWAVSARGFNDLFANKLLVLIDGRSAYSPLFSGVFWDMETVPVDEIERIEVVRGPGATLWGANAVNGVVNIITRSAGDAQGLRAGVGLGTRQRYRGRLSWSGPLGRDLNLRISGSARDEDGLSTADGWRAGELGLRLDGRLSQRDSLTVRATLHDGEAVQTYRISLAPTDTVRRAVPSTATSSQAVLQGGWLRQLSAKQDLALRLAVQHARRDDLPVDVHLTVVDLDVQHHVEDAADIDWVWGLGYRHARDRSRGTFATRLQPANRSYSQRSVFAQGTWRPAGDGLRLSLGAKLEQFDLGGTALQPNVRLAWSPSPSRTLWAAVSRAVRTPSRADHDLRAAQPAPSSLVPADLPTIFAEERGSRDFVPEIVTAWEAGARGSLGDGLGYDVALFHSRYDRLRTTEPGFPESATEGDVTYLVLPLGVHNRMSAQTTGAEIALDWRPRPGLRLRPSYAFLHMDIDLDADSRYAAGRGWEGVSPRHQARLQAGFDLGRAQVDLRGRYVSELSYIGLDGYASLDGRLGWQLDGDWGLVLTGHDLLQSDHAEFRIPHLPIEAADPQREVRLTLRWAAAPGL